MTPSATLRRYWVARRSANRALLQWITEQPDAHEVAQEIDDAVAELQQLKRLSRSGRPPWPLARGAAPR